MAAIKLKGDTSGEVTIQAPAVAGTTTLNLPATSSTLATQNALGVRNLIINGDMRIDQRNAGSSVANSAGAAYYLDRWQVATAQASKMNIEQNAGSVTPPDSFSNYLGMTVTSAYTAGASDYYLLAQKIEGFNASHLKFGTSNAQDITISFKVYSSLTGTFCAALQNAAQNRTYIFNYTISSANTWTTITKTIPGDTSGTWGSGNASWGELKFDLGSGSNYQTSTVDSWAATDDFTTSSSTKFVANASATFYITGLQLEVGDTATPFEHRPYDMELARCERYYQRISDRTGEGANRWWLHPISGGNVWRRASVFYRTPMRNAPTATITAIAGGGATFASGNPYFSNANTINGTIIGDLTAPNDGYYAIIDDLYLDAEL